MPPSSGALLKEGWQGEVLYGVSSVLAALTAGRREIHALHIQQDIDGSARKVGAVLTGRLAVAGIGRGGLTVTGQLTAPSLVSSTAPTPPRQSDRTRWC